MPLFSKTKLAIVGCAVMGIGGFKAYDALSNKLTITPSDKGKAGAPIDGLTLKQLSYFDEGKRLFKHEFTPDEGLGPLFNGSSCFECHGQPSTVVGGEGRDISSTNITMFARRDPEKPIAKVAINDCIRKLTKADVDLFPMQGGPTLQRRTVTTEFPNKYDFNCQVDFESIPKNAEFISHRHSPMVLGDGLIENIPDSAILATALEEGNSAPEMAGRPVPHVDRFTELPRIARLGWKCQNVNLLNFTTGALNIEMGLTTFLNNTENSPQRMGMFPKCIIDGFGAGPNDTGKKALLLTYFQQLLAAPPRGAITEEVKHGEKVFNQVGCAFCHKPQYFTADNSVVLDPESPLPKLNYLKIPSMQHAPVNLYSDLLVHDMGLELADGIPQEGAKGGEWRTTPLWGTGMKKFYLHDGRTNDLHEAIMAHGGQSEAVKNKYAALPSDDRKAIKAFLKSL
jgi:CxxC motif-containing protein (DUF1111 family)